MLPVITVCASLLFKLQLYFANVFLGFLVPVLNKGGNVLILTVVLNSDGETR